MTKGIDKMLDGSFNINFSDFGILPGLIETDVFKRPGFTGYTEH